MHMRILRTLTLAFVPACASLDPGAIAREPAPPPADPPSRAAEIEPRDDRPAVTAPPGNRPELPPGFGQLDAYPDLASACEGTVELRVEREDLRGPILEWCHVRAYASSRNGRVRSRLDGSWIHDRDRPSAYSFYRGGLRSGVLDPETCEHHVVDTDARRSRDASTFPDRWPYGTYCDRSLGECRPSHPGTMRGDVAEDWMSHPPDYERFGTRGPMDNNFTVAVKHLGGCFPPEALDRFDVAAAVVVERSVELCLRLEDRLRSRRKRAAAQAAGLPTRCRSYRDIRAIWHPRFWYDRLPAALDSA